MDALVEITNCHSVHTNFLYQASYIHKKVVLTLLFFNKNFIDDCLWWWERDPCV